MRENDSELGAVPFRVPSPPRLRGSAAMQHQLAVRALSRKKRQRRNARIFYAVCGVLAGVTAMALFLVLFW